MNTAMCCSPYCKALENAPITVGFQKATSSKVWNITI